MKRSIATSAAIVMLAAGGFGQNYTIAIDGKETPIDLAKPTPVKLADGRTVTLVLKQKEVVRFTSDAFSFEHKSIFSPSRTKLDENAYQTMMASPQGTVVMIQEYGSINPAPLIDMLLKELTKEEVKYGYKYAESPARQTLSDGTVLTGKKAVTTYRDDEWTRSVLCYGGKDEGILVVTAVEKGNWKQDGDIIDRFWKTFKILKPK